MKFVNICHHMYLKETKTVNIAETWYLFIFLRNMEWHHASVQTIGDERHGEDLGELESDY